MDCTDRTLALLPQRLLSEFPGWQIREYESDIACNIRSIGIAECRNGSLSVRQIESEETFGW